MRKPRTKLMGQLQDIGLNADDAAKQLKVDRTTLFRWAKKGVPLGRLDDVHNLTGIPLTELRPDLAQKFNAA